MSFTPRPYQVEAINSALEYFEGKNNHNAFQILPTGSGKSVCIANVAKELKEQTIIFQPSKEILEQNLKKYMACGLRAGVYSASAGSKYIDKVTFATIGSVAKKHHLFRNVKNILIDECHLVNAKDGMYHDFIKSLPDSKMMGFTATPYRLTSGFDGAQLKFLNRTNPRIFNKVNYFIQNDVLFNAGHLAKLEYFSFNVVDRTKLEMNSTGTDFTDRSLKDYYKNIGMINVTINYANRVLAKRRNLLLFCSLISEANEVSKGIQGSVVLTGETDKKDRERIIMQFKSGVITCLIVVGMLTTGFDYPELEAVMIARSTMSLALYYQIVGRGMRPHPNKESCWIIDLGGNINFFGKIETMRIQTCTKGLFSVWNNGRQLTNVTFTKN